MAAYEIFSSGSKSIDWMTGLIGCVCWSRDFCALVWNQLWTACMPIFSRVITRWRHSPILSSLVRCVWSIKYCAVCCERLRPRHTARYVGRLIDWARFNVPPKTHYRSYWGRFLQIIWQKNSVSSESPSACPVTD